MRRRAESQRVGLVRSKRSDRATVSVKKGEGEGRRKTEPEETRGTTRGEKLRSGKRIDKRRDEEEAMRNVSRAVVRSRRVKAGR